MKAFSDLYQSLDSTSQTNEKIQALVHYFQHTPPEDSAWAIFLLSGNRFKQLIGAKLLKQWIIELSHLPEWLFIECYGVVGDLSETISLLLPPHSTASPQPLHWWIEQYIQLLKNADIDTKKQQILAAWQQLSTAECFIFNKIITGQFRVGVAKKTIIKALAQFSHLDENILAYRLMGKWEPSVANYQRLLDETDTTMPGSMPYPFMLAYPFQQNTQTLGEVTDWLCEWKWDGIRAQLIKRGDECALWSRGEELINEQFPELIADIKKLPTNFVLDGELLVWEKDHPASFNQLQKRLNRKVLTPKIIADYPIAFMAYDLLEDNYTDLRAQDLLSRRAALTRFMQNYRHPVLKLSELIPLRSWEELEARRTTARELGIEGLMIKHQQSPYLVGRKKNFWWKYKVDPLSVDAVLIYAQRGHGRRANLFTDYTFGLWEDGELVTFAKAYTGLTDAELKEVNRFIRQHTVTRFGPIVQVTPQLVFEIAFDAVNYSKRHRSGVAVRFPVIRRWRHDKPATEANSVADIKSLVLEK